MDNKWLESINLCSVCKKQKGTSDLLEVIVKKQNRKVPEKKFYVCEDCYKQLSEFLGE